MNWAIVDLSTALASARVFVDGDWVESEDQDPAGDVRLIQLADVGDGSYLDKSSRFLTSSKARQLRCTFLEQGDVLVARMPDPLGRACIFPGDSRPSVTVVDVCIIRPDCERHDPRWLMHILNAPSCRNQIAGFATGTTRSRISRSNLGKIKIPAMPLPEQRRIAEILDWAEALRAKRRAALAQLEALTQSIFHDLFGSPSRSGNSFPHISLGDVAEFIDYRGISPKKQSTGVRLITARNIKRGWFEDDPKEFIPADEFDDWMRRGIPRTGDVLFTTEGHTLGSAAKLPKFEKAALAQRLIALQPRKDAESDYLLQVILGPAFQQEVRRRSTGSAARGISSKHLAQITIPLPPVSLQHEFSARVAKVDQLKKLHKTAIRNLGDLFATLQNRAFRGEL